MSGAEELGKRSSRSAAAAVAGGAAAVGGGSDPKQPAAKKRKGNDGVVAPPVVPVIAPVAQNVNVPMTATTMATNGATTATPAAAAAAPSGTRSAVSLLSLQPLVAAAANAAAKGKTGTRSASAAAAPAAAAASAAPAPVPAPAPAAAAAAAPAKRSRMDDRGDDDHGGESNDADEQAADALLHREVVAATAAANKASGAGAGALVQSLAPNPFSTMPFPPPFFMQPNQTPAMMLQQMQQFLTSQGITPPSFPLAANPPASGLASPTAASSAAGAAGASTSPASAANRKKKAKTEAAGGAASAASAAQPSNPFSGLMNQMFGAAGAAAAAASPLAAQPLSFAAQVPVQSAIPPSSIRGDVDCLLSSLPGDLQLSVYSFLRGSEVALLSRASKYLHTVTANPRVWKGVCMQACKYPCAHSDHPWKELYITRMAKLRDKYKATPERQYKSKHYFVCNVCQCIKGFQTEADLEHHMQLRHGPNRMRPPIPQKRPAKVDPATGIVLQRIGSVYPCPVPGCIKQFNKAIELKYHFDGVHKQSRAFPCDYPNCFKSFVSPAQLNLHKCKHTGMPRPHMCTHPGCNKTFNTPSQVAKHAQSHLDKSQRIWLPCPQPGCTQQYATQSAIKKHIATAHDHSQLRFRCSDQQLLGVFLPPGPQRDAISNNCNAAFFTKATWVEHLRNKHRIEPTHPQLMEVVRIMRGLPALPGLGLGNLMAMQMQYAAAQNAPTLNMHMGMTHAGLGNLMAMHGHAHGGVGGPQGSTPQQLAANAVAQAMQQAAAAAGGAGAQFSMQPGLLGMPPLPPLPQLPQLPSAFPSGGMSATQPLGTGPAASAAVAVAAAAAAAAAAAQQSNQAAAASDSNGQQQQQQQQQ